MHTRWRCLTPVSCRPGTCTCSGKATVSRSPGLPQAQGLSPAMGTEPLPEGSGRGVRPLLLDSGSPERRFCSISPGEAQLWLGNAPACLWGRDGCVRVRVRVSKRAAGVGGRVLRARPGPVVWAGLTDTASP